MGSFHRVAVEQHDVIAELGYLTGHGDVVDCHQHQLICKKKFERGRGHQMLTVVPR